MFGKEKQQTAKRKTAEKKTGNRSSSVRSMLLPVFAVAVLMIALACLVARWLTLQNDQQRMLQGLVATAKSMTQLSEVRVEVERTALGLLAQDSELIEVLSAQHDVTQVQNRLKQQLPAAGVLLVIPANMEQPRLLQTLSDSYLALNLQERVLKTGAVPAIEASNPPDGSVFMVVVPVKQQRQVLGTLFARYDMDLITKPLQQLQLGIGVIGLEQVVDNTHFVLAGSPGFEPALASASLPVKDTLWQIKYGMTASTELTDLSLLSVLVMIAALAIYLVLNKQQKKLVHAIKTDMGTAASLMDATLKRTGAPLICPRISESAAALEHFEDYARATYTAAKAAASRGKTADSPVRQAMSGDAVDADATDTSKPVDRLPMEIFLANDIRGVTGRTLTPSMCQQLGAVVGTLALNAGENSLHVGRDARLSSDEFASALIAGVLSSGCDVLDLGLVPAPLLYYAGHVLSSRSCVMVTGGHNPAEYNGLKIIIDGKPLAGNELSELREMVESGNVRSGVGSLQTRDISGEYIRQVTDDIQLLEPRKVVVDGGNGVGAGLLVRLLRGLECEVVELFCDPDGEFPNHFPDPADPENLSALALEVQAQGAAFGVALDGDGDRLALVDEKGQQVATDLLIMLLAADIIRRHPGADVIYDVKSSSYLASFILSNGGRPVMWKTGHALMKIKMLETGSLLGGEYAGHLHIKDRWFGFDDAVYATVRLLELFSMESEPISTLFRALPKASGNSVLELEMPRNQASSLLQKLSQQADEADMDVIELDGLRFEFSDGWALIRLSNTLPRLVFRFEGRSQSALEHAQTYMRSQIHSIMPDLSLPF